MAATPQRRLVHKQFNSPLGLYSQTNVQHVLDQHIKELDNGTIGIDFKNDITTAVPSNLQKSAVLRALEEEERQTGTRQTSEHQSRSRTRRDVDRETVLRINRHPVRHRSAECVWPPRRLSSSPVPKPLPPKRPPAQTRKLGEGMSHSHQNISEIRDIFENQSNRSESNTLTRLLRGISEKRDTSSGKGEERNIIINDARIDSEQRKNKKNLNTHDNNRKEEHCEVEEEILCKNIHLWPPISSLQSSNLNKARRHDAPKDGNDNVEQIIKRHFPIIDKNYDEIGGKYEKNINFHDWHGKPSSDINDVVDETAKGIVKRVAWPPPSDSEHSNGQTQNTDEQINQTEQLEQHKQHFQHLDELRQQHLQQQHHQQPAVVHAPPPSAPFSPQPQHTHHQLHQNQASHVAKEIYHPIEGVASFQQQPPTTSFTPHVGAAEVLSSQQTQHFAPPSPIVAPQLKGWKPVQFSVSNLQRTASGNAPAVEHVTLPPFELPKTVAETVSSEALSNGFHQNTTQFQHQQQNQGFHPVAAPAQNQQQQQFHQQQNFGQGIKSPSPAPRVVNQSPSNQYPGLITPLRKEAPITQQPSPVFSSQPAAAIIKGGSNMRGDQKWPPAETKMQMELENEQRRKLAQGPAFRPKRMHKDYSQFFAKNALNSTYPGYRAPPGTQYFAVDKQQM
ncbi:probable serine/threonine-protein kinase DDB_G0280133 isoform X3 [Culicoides brevitarsis]|uniref:probable serine/threonine-protein kinase DDB_G0280133 isoform X3 n=1 Tax=Culicoides brevitarsis TaxID=469753 RepID=UPI00307B2E26